MQYVLQATFSKPQHTITQKPCEWNFHEGNLASSWFWRSSIGQIVGVWLVSWVGGLLGPLYRPPGCTSSWTASCDSLLALMTCDGVRLPSDWPQHQPPQIANIKLHSLREIGGEIHTVTFCVQLIIRQFMYQDDFFALALVFLIHFSGGAVSFWPESIYWNIPQINRKYSHLLISCINETKLKLKLNSFLFSASFYEETYRFSLLNLIMHYQGQAQFINWIHGSMYYFSKTILLPSLLYINTPLFILWQ